MIGNKRVDQSKVEENQLLVKEKLSIIYYLRGQER